MRKLVFALFAVALAGPALALAEPAPVRLQLVRFEAPAANPLHAKAPAAHLDVGALEADAPMPIPADLGGGDGPSPTRLLALILGIIPGFGLGHLIGGSGWWVTWFLVDVVLAIVFWWFFPWYLDFVFFRGLGGLVIFVERIFEGMHAYWSTGWHRRRRGDLVPGLGEERLASVSLSAPRPDGVPILAF